jgi:dTDP-3-amino-3,4,6-trideoxy-alpha-D-glucose transaminase
LTAAAIPLAHALHRVPLTRMDGEDTVLFEQLLAAVRKVASTGQFILGDEVEQFESEFAAYCEASRAVGVASGTDALALSLRALDIGPGDEVLVPANSFIATAEAVSLVGATPRFVDVDPFTHTITAETVEQAIGHRTAAVMAVHLYGRTVDLDPIIELARAAEARVIEDACQAHGARYKGRRVGAIGDVGCFSFYPAKNLGGWGDGGAVTTNDPALADRVSLLRSHGERPRYRHHEVGTTSRLDAIQAAVLRVKLRKLDEWNDRRRSLASRLTSSLADAPVSQPVPPGRDLDHVFHQYVITTRSRDELRRHLDQSGVSTGIHYPVPIHRTRAYEMPSEVSLPVVEQLAGQICSLPIYPDMTDAELSLITESITHFDWSADDHEQEVAR